MRRALITCDLCGREIDTSKHWTSMNVAVPEDVAVQVADDARRQVVEEHGSPSAVLGVTFTVRTPTHCAIEICRACEDEKYADLRPMIAVLLLTQIEKRRERAAHPNAQFERAE